MILPILSIAASAIRFEDLGLSPIALDLGFLQIRWYSLAYLVGILLAYWYMLKLLSKPGAPMARRHADDLLFYATLGVILGGRIGYVLFYQPGIMANPLDIFKVWQGGMSFHGGFLGVTVALAYLSWRNKLSFIQVSDYIACCVPFGLLFGRLANFVNGELWGRPTDVAWAVIFPGDPLGLPRHPSQLYEAGLEGLMLVIVLSLLFWKTQARFKPGMLAGTFLLGYGISRFVVEWFRNPDAQLVELATRTGLSMGQWLTVPMILVGLYLILSSGSRQSRAVPA